MGNEMSHEAKAIVKKVLDLRRDHSNWKSVIEEFNTVVPPDYSVKKFEDKRVVDLVLQLLATQLKESPNDQRGITNLLEASRRLLKFKGLYKGIAKCNILPWIQALQSDNFEIVQAALAVMRNLIEYTGLETKEEGKILMESQARDLIFQNRGFGILIDVLKRFPFSAPENGTVVAGTLRNLAIVLLTSPRSTPADAIMPLMTSLQPMISQLLEMSYDNTPDVCYFGILMVQALILHADPKTTKKIQTMALSSGCLLRHFFISVSGEEGLQSRKQIGSNAKTIILESRNLIGLLTDGHTKSTDTVQRCLPNHLLKRLWEDHPFPNNFAFAKLRTGVTTLDATWQRYQKGTHRANWIAVFAELDQEHNFPHLIWNETTRRELLETLSNEVLELEHQRKRNATAEWDYEGFEPRYPSVEAELQVHGYYLKQLLATLNDPNSSYEINQKDLVTLINHLYNHAVIEDKPIRKWACLRTMSALYKRYSQVLLDFEPLGYLVWLMSPKHTRPLWRGHILEFFRDLLQHQPNARRFMQADGVRHLVTYMSQAHTGPAKFLHGRQMSLEPIYAIPVHSGTSELTSLPIDEETENQSEEFGPLPPEMNNSQLADVCIDLLKLLLNRVPRLCKSIAKMAEFQHILQFLLSPDVVQANKITPIITQLSLNSASAQTTLWQRGVFLFLFCAVGDEIDTNAVQLLQLFHMKQAEEFGTSILTPFLPFPMIRFLTLQSTEKFCQVFDGNVNQPDLIWNRSLRDRLVQSARNDAAQFASQLRDRPMTLYTFSKPTTVVYPELIDEVCCGGIYLKNLVKEPGFEIADPVYMMSGFVEAMRIGLGDEDLLFLIQCQIIAVDRFPELQQCSHYPAFSELLKILTKDVRQDFDFRLIDQTAGLVHRLLMIPNSDNLQICLQEDGFVNISQSLLNSVQFDIAAHNTANLIQTLIRIMNILSFANEDAIIIMHENPQVIIELVSLIVENFANMHPAITVEALRLFKILAESQVSCPDILTSGALLSITKLAFFFSDGTDVVTEAIKTLSAFSLMADSPELAKFEMKNVLRQLLTPGLLVRLGKPERFLLDSRSNFWTPCLIWGDIQRQELNTFLESQITIVQQSHFWDYNAAFPDLKYTDCSTEIQVCDVFLRLYNEQIDFHVPNEPKDFMSGLVLHLHSVATSVSTSSPQSRRDIFEDVSVTAGSIARLLHDAPTLIRSPSHDELVNAINNLFDTIDRDIFHAALIILDVLSRNESSFNVTTQYAFAVHRLVNFQRETLADNPSLRFALQIIKVLCKQDSEIVDAFFDDGLLISLTKIFTDSRSEAVEYRLIAAEILGILATEQRKGEAYMDMLAHIFAPTFREYFSLAKENPKALIDFYDDNHDTPIVFWNSDCRRDLVSFITQELNTLVTHQTEALSYGVSAPPYQWSWGTIHERFNQKTLGAEIYIDGIYINAFNANPYFQVKPDRFFLKLVEALYGVYAEYESFRDQNQHEWVKTTVKNLLALWEAAFNLLTNLPHLQDRCVDYLDYVFGYFHPTVDISLQLSVLKIACILATNALCAENIAKFRLVKNIMPLLETLRLNGCIPQVLNFLLDCIRRSSPVVSQIRSTGGLVMLLNIVIGSDYKPEEREGAAMIISAMVQDNVFGLAVSNYATLVLTDKFKTIFQARPSKFIDFVDADHLSPVDNRTWNSQNRTMLKELLKAQSTDLATSMWYWDGNSDVWDTSLLSSIWADVLKKPASQQTQQVEHEPNEAIAVENPIVDMGEKIPEDMGTIESLKDEINE